MCGLLAGYDKTTEKLLANIQQKLYQNGYVGNHTKELKCSHIGVGSFHIIKFSGEFDYYFRGEYPYLELTNRFKNMISSNDYMLEELIRSGIEDGSIRPDIDPVLTGLTISNVLLSL